MTGRDTLTVGGHDLDRLLDRYATLAPRVLLLAVPLAALAFLTNPVPDPSFPWATLPADWRLPVTQPRIEHWPVTYTVAIWLSVAAAPGLFLAGYRRFRERTPRAGTVWLAALPTAGMFVATTYCRLFWPKPGVGTWNAPSYTLVCWGYCSTYVPVWSNAAFLVADLGVVATGLALTKGKRARHALTAFGILAFPLGIPAIYAGLRGH